MDTGYVAIGLLCLALIVGLAISRFVHGKDQAFSDAASTFQTILTAGAIMLAGYWYFVERRGKPHADISQVISIVPIKPGFVAVETQINIKNVGETLLEVTRAQIWLQQVSPPPESPGALVPENLTKLGVFDWPRHTPADKDGYASAIYTNAEFHWPPIKVYRDKVMHEIEPGESDAMIATFMVKCDVQVVRVAAYVYKGGQGKNERWWRTAAFANTSEACGRTHDDKK
ncbi:MAG: hypothetical protein EON48_13145 [Acetobacteraceae bacterium]|nr:MAG: hypothetical protein EON48_13145 [Acetobacteraceae bacterium]